MSHEHSSDLRCTVTSMVPVSETTLRPKLPWRVKPGGLQNMKFSHLAMATQAPAPARTASPVTGRKCWVGCSRAVTSRFMQILIS